MPELERFDATDTLNWDSIWRAFDADGGLIVEHFIDPGLLERLQKDFAPLIASSEPGSTTEGLWTQFHGDQTKRITGLPKYSTAWVELLCDERYQMMGDRYLGADDYWLNTGQLICIGPDETPQMLHRDELNWPHAMRAEEITVTAIFALTDFTEENGATRIVPASHRLDHCPDPKGKYETMPAEMKRGSVLVWHGSLWHGGGANRSSARRTGIAMNYCAGFIRQQENQQLGIPREIAQSFGVELQRLVGYGVFRGLIGHIEKRDPIELLGGSDELRVIWDR